MIKRTTLVSASIAGGILIILSTGFIYGQRGGRATAAASRGSWVGAANGSGIGVANGSGVGGIDLSRRTSVIDGVPGNRLAGSGLAAGRPSHGRIVAHPLAAAAAIRRVPLGTVVEVLPADCQMTFINEIEHFYCGGQYYQLMGTETEPIYVAVEPYIPDDY